MDFFDFSIFFRGYHNSNHYIFGLGFFFSGKIPLIGTTGWKECVYGEWIFLIGLYLFKEIFSKGWEEGENGGWKL